MIIRKGVPVLGLTFASQFGSKLTLLNTKNSLEVVSFPICTAIGLSPFCQSSPVFEVRLFKRHRGLYYSPANRSICGRGAETLKPWEEEKQPGKWYCV